MNKRSATLIAASLVGVLAVAGAAFASGITGPTTSAASEPTPTPASPIVRQTKTVVVHRQAAAPASFVAQASPSGSPSPSIPGDDGSHHANEGPDDHGDHGNEGPDDHGDHGNEGPDDHGHDDDDERPDDHGDHGNEGSDDHGDDDD